MEGTSPPTEPSAQAELEDIVRCHVAELLDLPANRIRADQPLEQLGLDSIFAMDLAERLTDETGRDIEGYQVYELETVERLARFLDGCDRTVGSPEPSAAQRSESADVLPVQDAAPNPLPGFPAASLPADASEATGWTAPAEHAVRRLVEEAVGGSVDPRRTFEDTGLTSIEMLRTVSALEQQLGPLPKTLLFDQPDLPALTRYLSKLFGRDAVARLGEGSEGGHTAPHERHLDTAVDASVAALGAVVVVKRRLAEHPELAAVVRDLTERHGVESGLAGRDIAPLLFLGSARSGYLEFARHPRAILAWSYTGEPGHAYREVIREFVALAQDWGLAVNLLSPTPIAEVSGVPFNATPFGVVQQIEDLRAFSLDGGPMRRLRGLLNRFAKQGRCEVIEYTAGSDSHLDAAILALIDDWAGGKKTLNPYVATVRRDLVGGTLPTDHRMFLTKLGDRLVAAVVLTRMPADEGYLLDLEFTRGDMPLGGSEHTIVTIMKTLRDEGVKVFSFGVTFGVKVCDSPNSSARTERALAELAAAGMTGATNYQFKRKFRPNEMPVYLCQPADALTDVGDIMLMIAAPTQSAQPSEPGASTRPTGSTAASCRASSVADSVARPASEEASVSIGMSVPATRREGREGVLTAAGWNVLRLDRADIEVDLLSDSWVERDDTWITAKMARLLTESGAVGDTIDQPWLPFGFVAPTTSGRAAEALLSRAWPGRRGGVVLHNGLFPTFLGHLAEAGFNPVAVVHSSDDQARFAGDLPQEALEESLVRHGREVAFVVVEPGSNAGGGRPMSLANLREARDRLAVHHVPLVLDATRLLDDALAIVQHERGQQGRNPWEVAHEILALADAATLSLSKDFGLNFGGLLATNLSDLDARLHEVVIRYGSDVGVSHRRLLQHALSDRDGLLRDLHARRSAVAALGRRLADAGIPVVIPVGGHCVLLDIARMPGLADFEQPVEASLAWMYRHSGVRGAPHLAGAGAHPTLSRCIRFAVPVGMSDAEVQAAGDRLAELFEGPHEPVDLVRVGGHRATPQEARYGVAQADDGDRPLNSGHRSSTGGTGTRTEVPFHRDWFRQQLRELGDTLRGDDYAPANENLAVLQELHANVECRMVEDRDGEVEVFLAGAGPTLVLMHPFNIGVGMFAHQIAGLSDRFRIVVVHQPGVGRTRVSSELSLEGLSQLQRRVLTTLGIDGPLHVGGASVGSIFAQYFTLHYPDFVRSLSLLGGSYKFANRRGQIDKLDQVIAEDFDMIEAGTGRPAPNRQQITELLLRCESMDPRTGLRYIDLFSKEAELTPRLPEIQVPTLVLQGRHDSVVGVKTGHFLHGAIPTAHYVELPVSGHFVCFTDARRVNEELTSFMRVYAIVRGR